MMLVRGFVAVFLLLGIAGAALAPARGLGSPEDLAALPRRSIGGKLRIVHFGDSHTAADTLQVALRNHFQQSLGNGGTGLFMPCTTRASRCSRGWTLLARPGPGLSDDYLGLPGMLLQTSRPGETIQVDGEFSLFRAFFLKQPGGGRVRFFVNGAPIGDMDLSGAWRQAVPYLGRLPRRGPHRLEIRTLGGAVRVLSLNLEDEMPGVVYSPLGVIGARAENLLHINPEAFNTQLAWESPDFVIVAYGTNESSGAGVDEAAYSARVGEIVERIRGAAPSAAVLLVGPPDRGGADPFGSLPALGPVIRAIESAARQKNVGFLDLKAAMGGPGTASRWAAANPPLAQPDRTHFTPLGYQRLAAYIASAVQAGPAAVATVAEASQRIYRVRGADGHITVTNNPETVRMLVGQGGTLEGN
jgi:lysophospholipase L1-like esterase